MTATPTPGQLDLGELITTLEAADPDKVVPFGFDNPHSYRGYYHDLAFEIATDVTVAAMLADARSALHATYEGWKGGDYTMDEDSDVWLVWERGDCGETLGRVLLHLMLAPAVRAFQHTHTCACHCEPDRNLYTKACRQCGAVDLPACPKRCEHAKTVQDIRTASTEESA